MERRSAIELDIASVWLRFESMTLREVVRIELAGLKLESTQKGGRSLHSLNFVSFCSPMRRFKLLDVRGRYKAHAEEDLAIKK